MTTLLASSTATSATAQEGHVKTFLDNLRTFMADLLGTDSANKALALMSLGAALNGSSAKTGAYTVIQSDRGKVITCSGTFPLNINAAATLGDGFVFGVWNTGSGVITIDPNLSETIDGATTKTIGAGKFAIVFCNGSSFGTIGIGFALADLLALDGTGSGLDADLLDGLHASSFIRTDSNLAVGCFIFAHNASASTVYPGGTIAGSSLYYASATQSSGIPPGTYRCLGYGASGDSTLYQRIA